MTTPIPTRFSDAELAVLDELVAAGVGETRSSVIRRALWALADSMRRAETGRLIAASYRQQPQTANDDEAAMANALAITEAEPW